MSSGAPSAGNRNNTQPLWSDGWLVVVIYFVIFSWARWVSVGGFAFFYEHKQNANGEMETKGKTGCQDCLHFAWTVVSIILFFWMESPPASFILALILALSSFRIVDLFVDCFMLAVFGNRYGRPWQATMSPRRLHRTLIIDILLFLELVFWNASWAFIVAKIDGSLYHEALEKPAHALHLSVATVTTIGYGTYAPVAMLSIFAAFLQAISALLLLSGVIGGVFSHNTSQTPGSPTHSTQLPFSQDSYGLRVIWDEGFGWRLRCVLPVILPLLFVLVVASVLWRMFRFV